MTSCAILTTHNEIAEEVAVALVVASREAKRFVSDLKTAIRTFLAGRISPSAAEIHQTFLGNKCRHVRVVWTPEDAFLVRNELPNDTAQDFGNQAHRDGDMGLSLRKQRQAGRVHGDYAPLQDLPFIVPCTTPLPQHSAFDCVQIEVCLSEKTGHVLRQLCNPLVVLLVTHVQHTLRMLPAVGLCKPFLHLARKVVPGVQTSFVILKERSLTLFE